jgi:hypothetical protein
MCGWTDRVRLLGASLQTLIANMSKLNTQMANPARIQKPVLTFTTLSHPADTIMGFE